MFLIYFAIIVSALSSFKGQTLANAHKGARIVQKVVSKTDDCHRDPRVVRLKVTRHDDNDFIRYIREEKRTQNRKNWHNDSRTIVIFMDLAMWFSTLFLQQTLIYIYTVFFVFGKVEEGRGKKCFDN